MKNIYRFAKSVKNFIFNKTAIRFVACVLLFMLFAESSTVFHYYEAGKEHIRQNDPRKLQNRSETVFAFAPWELKRGMKISLNEIANHLREISYAESAENSPASFHIDGATLKINSRLPQIFPDAILTFEKNHLKTVAAGDQSVDSVKIEPLSMQNAVVYINEDNLAEHRIRRIVLQPDNLPVPIVDAVLSTEDKNFYNHFGINWLSVATRPIYSLGRQGGSSITQQLIKNNIVSGAKNEYWQITDSDSFRFLKTFERKTAELSMALAVEQVLAKNQILAAYLSMNYMGSSSGVNLQGFGAASQEYFSTNIYDISDFSDPSDLAKAATLSGMIQGPEKYLKFVRNGEKCAENDNNCLNLLDRRNKILNFMRENYPDKYSQEVIETAKHQPLGFGFASQNRQERPLEADSRIFAKYAMQKENLPNELQKLRGEEGEVFVYTSLDERLQRDAVAAVKGSMQKLQARVDAVTRKQKADNPQAFVNLEKKCLEKNSKNPQVCDDLYKVTASLIAIDARTGEILAMTGDVDAASIRSPGSLVKPFFYLKAIEIGSLFGQPFTAATYIDKNRDAALLSEYCAENINLGGSGLAHEHLSRSWNIGACFAAQSAGIPTDFVGKITNSTPERKLIAALGGTNGSETSLLNLVRAYTVFANNGKLINPTAYKNAFQTENDKFNQINFTGNQSAERLNPGATFITTQMLKSVVEEGTAANFRQIAKLPADADFAGKTGSGMISDLWFVGFSPRILVGIWCGVPENLPHLRSADGFTGGKTAAPIAAEFLQSVAKYRSELLEGKFIQPETVVKRNVDANNGCLVLSDGREEYFIEGRESQPCK